MIINSFFAKWVQSYRDLPLLINQWANVVRWELRPRIFLRTTEFLWQEGHTAHATYEDARDYAVQILHDVYEDFMVNVLAIPVLVGQKTVRERFAGADNTLTCEAMMRDGKALQMGTSHELGQNFSKVFDTTYLDDHGEQVHVWQTSWGVSTRMVGGLIMAHGDDQGLRVPPALAPIQVVVLAVRDDAEVLARSARISKDLEAAGVRARLDDHVDRSFGRRATDWELKGVPVRVELGPRDLAAGTVTIARRDDGSKRSVAIDGVVGVVEEALASAQRALLDEATQRRDEATVDVSSIDEAIEVGSSGFARLSYGALGEAGEDQLAEHALTVRCLQRPDGTLPAGEDTELVAYVARAY